MTRISGMKRSDFDGVKIAQAICNFTTKHPYSIKRKVYYRILVKRNLTFCAIPLAEMMRLSCLIWICIFFTVPSMLFSRPFKEGESDFCFVMRRFRPLKPGQILACN